ncbi:site-specific DNA-methyltransferase [Dehalogenimonas sp. THU2]|uniref:site-specific DNA-methyltransferase n=1 Tax=Dehalogenimonas sp. THU2 TaxID=3151121 RepID=UPI003218A318
MKKLTTQDSETKSTDIIKENIAELKTLFPEALTEDKVDLNVLKQLLGGKVDETEEKYGLNWLGKRRSRQIALTPSSGTLRPCPGDSVDWETTQNLMIEGDNLEVLKLLQKSYARKVKLIYIDPPYNTGSDFVYPDDFQDNIKNYLMRTGQMESDGRKNSSNTEASGRWHTDWLNMMYPRLRLARNLLRDDGMIFISIDDNEIANLRKMCDDIFGEENYRNMVVIRRGAKSVQAQFNTWDKLGSGYEFILIYSKCSDYRFPQMRRSLDETRSGSWNNHWRGTDRPTMRYQLLGITPETGQWRWSQSRSEIAVSNFQEMLSTIGKTKEAITQEEIDAYYVERIDDDLDFIRLSSNGNPEHYVPPSDSVLLNDIWFDLPTSSSKEVLALFEQKKVFDNPKQTRLIQRILDFADKDAIVLDFFAGSGTTGHAVMAQNANDNGMRRYILIQLPEALNPQENGQKIAANFCDKLAKPHNIAELTKERLRRTAKKIRDEAPLFMGDLGFRVFKLDSSNIRAWEPDRDNLAATLEAHAEHIKTDRTEQDILFELLLKLGLDLTVPIEHKTIAGKTVHSIGAGTLIVCLDTQITSAEVEPLSLGIVEWHKQLAPAGEVQIVFRDSAFADDVSKTNLTAILDQYGLENVRSL